jgi:hypothetical protein
VEEVAGTGSSLGIDVERMMFACVCSCVSEVLRDVACGDWEGRKEGCHLHFYLSFVFVSVQRRKNRRERRKSMEREGYGICSVQCALYG